jgi:hypothetical protein
VSTLAIPGSVNLTGEQSEGDALDCPSRSTCVALAHLRSLKLAAIVFDPVRGTRYTVLPVESPSAVPGTDPPSFVGHIGQSLSCPSTSMCTAGDDVGRVVTFDPTRSSEPVRLLRLARSSDAIGAVDCPSTSECVGIALNSGTVYDFNPGTQRIRSQGLPRVDRLGNVLGAGPTSGSVVLACEAVNQCTAANGDTLGSGVTTFNPATPSRSQYSDDRQLGADGFACPARTECVAAGHYGVSVFNPLSN